MALECGFFNSIDNDRRYNARDLSCYFENIFSSGIFKRIENCMKVSPAGGMKLSVAIGAGLIDCQWFRARAAQTVTVPTAHAVLPRIDNIVVRLDFANDVRDIFLTPVSGSPAEAPIAPDAVNTTSMKDLVIARVRVRAGTTEITEDDIIDTRENEELCGYVHNLVDTPARKTYNTRYVATANNTTVAPISIPTFNPAVDVLNVYINGFRLAPGIEYTINEATNSIALAEAIDAGTIVDFEALVSMMPEEGITKETAALQAMAEALVSLESRTTDLEADTGWMQLTGAAGINFSEYWVPKLRRIGKTVHLRGLCTGVTANQTQLLTIPDGFRPPAGGHAYVGYCGNADDVRAARLFVEETGEVIFRSAGAVIPAASDPILITTSWLID